MSQNKKLNELHDLVIEELLRQIKEGTATASTLNVARQVLKDNAVVILPDTAPEDVKDLEELLEGIKFYEEDE